MVYSTQNHRVSVHCWSSGMLISGKHDVSETVSVSAFWLWDGDTRRVRVLSTDPVLLSLLSQRYRPTSQIPTLTASCAIVRRVTSANRAGMTRAPLRLLALSVCWCRTDGLCNVILLFGQISGSLCMCLWLDTLCSFYVMNTSIDGRRRRHQRSATPSPKSYFIISLPYPQILYIVIY
jgi:hypothetical protein